MFPGERKTFVIQREIFSQFNASSREHKTLEYYFSTYFIFPLTCTGLELLEMVMEKLDGRKNAISMLLVSLAKLLCSPNKCK